MSNDFPDIRRYIKYLSSLSYPYTYDVQGLNISVDKNVFPGNGEFGQVIVKTVLDQIMNNEVKTLFDYGCGCGVISVIAAVNGVKVVATDSNANAVVCTEKNIHKNKVANMVDIRLGHSLTTVNDSEKFDLIFAGLPWDNIKPRTELEKAFFDENFDMRISLLSKAKSLLNENGFILIPYSEAKEKEHPLQPESYGLTDLTILNYEAKNETYQIRKLSH